MPAFWPRSLVVVTNSDRDWAPPEHEQGGWLLPDQVEETSFSFPEGTESGSLQGQKSHFLLRWHSSACALKKGCLLTSHLQGLERGCFLTIPIPSTKVTMLVLNKGCFSHISCSLFPVPIMLDKTDNSMPPLWPLLFCSLILTFSCFHICCSSIILAQNGLCLFSPCNYP
jgi:hypothetical protein